jgi:hypothetical protein
MLSIPRFFKVVFYLWIFQHKYCMYLWCPSRVCCMFNSSNPVCSDHRNNIWRGLKSAKLFIMRFPPVTFYFLALRSKCFSVPSPQTRWVCIFASIWGIRSQKLQAASSASDGTVLRILIFRFQAGKQSILYWNVFISCRISYRHKLWYTLKPRY